MPQSLHPKYRPDIDGLRAIAILLVIIFHTFPEYLKGGFIGVDIFFVISGYLISTIIFENLDKNSFSFKDFYARRIRRIFPALTAVFLAALLVGWIFLFPDEFIELGRQIFKSSIFIQNFALAHKGGYFEKNSDLKPFLHLWSLCIEEQFYMVWPILMLACWKKLRKYILTIILIIILVSFIINIVTIHKNTAKAFYLPGSRFWELGMGGLLAYLTIYFGGFLSALAKILKRPAINDKNVRTITGFVGLACLIVCAAIINKEALFPGWWALLPVCGSFLIIDAGAHAWPNRIILSHPLAVFIGLISYPLYLWHWPILSFARIVTGETLQPIIAGGILIASFILAWLTYILIEKRIRFSQHKYTVLILVVSISVLAGLSMAVRTEQIHARLQSKKTEKIFSALNDWKYPGSFNFGKSKDFKSYTVTGDTYKTILIIGDSHVEQYWPRFKYAFDMHHFPKPTLVFATYGGCPPLPGVNRSKAGYSCDSFFSSAQKLAQNPNVKTVVYGSLWEGAFGLGNQKTGNLHAKADTSSQAVGLYRIADPKRTVLSYGSSDAEIVLNDFEKNIAQLRRQGKKVYIILSNPTGYAFNPKEMVSRFTGKVISTSIERDDYVERVAPLMNRLKAIAKRTGAIALDPVNALCDHENCPTVTLEGQPVYKDGNHMRPFYVLEKALFIDQTLN